MTRRRTSQNLISKHHFANFQLFICFFSKAPLLVNLCTALATGLISNWTPRPAARPNTASTIRIGSSGHKKPVGGGGQKGGGGGGGGAKKDESVKINIEPKGMEEIKKAIAVSSDQFTYMHKRSKNALKPAVIPI